MMTRLILLFSIVLLECIFPVLTATGPSITHISPTRGSINGATRLTLYGTGFPKSQFNWGAGNQNIGSYVELVYGTHKYQCDRHIDGCTATQITCDTKPMPIGDYTLIAKIDGKTIPDTSICASGKSKCVFKTTTANTPTIIKIEPTSGPPKSLVKMCGYIVTDRYGSNLIPADQVKLLRVYNGDKVCEVKDMSSPTDAFYGISKDDKGNGCITCKMGGNYVGPQNITFIVEKFGRSNQHIKTIRTVGQRIGMFTTYAVIDSISPTKGSIKGGTEITITGNYFDNTTSPIEVMVAGQKCTVTSMKMTQITCITQPQPASQTSYAGNRGFLKEEWTQTAVTTLQGFTALLKTASDYQSSFIDNIFSDDDNNNNHDHATKISGFITFNFTTDVRFHILADGKAWLYLCPTGSLSSKTEIASVPSSTTSYGTNSKQTSQKFSVKAGIDYCIEVLSSTTKVRVAVKSDESPSTATMSGDGQDEIKALIFNSTVMDEKQTLAFQNLVVSSTQTTSSTNEIQGLTISGISGNDAEYRLGLFGVYTGWISATAGAPAIRNAIIDLPSLYPDTVTVADQSTSTDPTVKKFDITFNTPMGNIPNMVSKVKPINSIVPAVVEKQAGVASRSNAYLTMGGPIPVSPAIAAGATDKEIEKALDGFFGVRCPPSIVKPSSGSYAFVDNFEDSGNSIGDVVNEIEPLCGRYSLKNPSYVYKAGARGYRLSDYNQFCFGYYGEVNQLKVIHDYFGATKKYTAYINLDLKPSPANQWNYTCIDIGKLIISKNPNERLHMASQIQIISDKSDDFYVDMVAALRDKAISSDIGVNFNDRRYLAAKPGGKPIKDRKVTGSLPTIDVNIGGNECANGFDLFKMAASQTTVTLTSTRKTAASPPAEGTSEVKFKGKSAYIQATFSEIEVENALETAFHGTNGIGKVKVEKHGDCANFAFFITFLTNRGDQEVMTKGANSPLKGTTVFSIETKANGGMMKDPITGNMVKTPHSKSQVTATVNGIRSKCRGTCDFEYLSSATPTLTSSTPSTGTQGLGTVVTLQGTMFSTSASENKVTIGGVDCPVNSQSLSATSLTCNVGNGPMGPSVVILNVDGTGQALGTYTFTYTSGITAVNPTSGSLGGGTLLTISGSGFASNAVPKVDGNDCIVQSSVPAKIICLTPNSLSASTVDVTIVQNGNTVTTTTKFTYDQSKTPTITSISPTTFHVFGGERITITGSGFGASASSASALKLDTFTASIVSYSDKKVVATAPAIKPGTYEVRLTVGSDGYANPVNNINGKINIKLVVKDTHPPCGSLYGGSHVTVFGEGFGTDTSKVSVSFGPYKCIIISVTDTEIKCNTTSTAKTHVITNNGSHPTYGKGYAWNPPILYASVGDNVMWQWASPTSGYKLSVNEKASVTDMKSKLNGFSSGPQKETSSYSRTLTSKGSKAYWSEFVDPAKAISLHGVIYVQDKIDTVFDLKLNVNGHEAVYDPSKRATMTPSNTGSCPWDVTPISSCQSLTGDPTKFWFKYQSCCTPKVISITRTQAASTQNIVLIGSGLSLVSCQNEITVGDYMCIAQSSTATKITCKVDPQGNMQIGDVNKFEMRHSNLGSAFYSMALDSSRSFILVPHISSITPTEGSTEGGVTLTLSGGGYTGIGQVTTVEVGSYNCPVEKNNLAYNKITCTTPRLGKDENKEVKVLVTTKNKQAVPAICSIQSGCAHYYKAVVTPTVTGAIPSQISGPTSITLTGTLFGTNSASVTVKIGGEVCNIQTSSFSNTQIVCDLASAPAGTHTVSVLISNKGLAKSSASVTSNAVLTSVTPSSGSTHGNTSITIAGNGFVFKKTVVKIDGKKCTITGTTLTSITCSTPAGTGAKSVEVESNGKSYLSSLIFTCDANTTPTVTNVQLPKGKAGDTITISGSSFSNDKTKIIVSIDGIICTVSQSSLTSITCTTGTHTPGQFPVKVNVHPVGLATSTSTYTYTITASSVSPNKGSLGGGHVITITGTGFNPQTTGVTVCGTACTVDKSASSSTQLICKTPVSTATATTSCDVVVSDNSQTATLSNAYQYDATMTQEITAVTPAHGPTLGGTSITITGTGFGNSQSAIAVTICGTTCAVQSVNGGTNVICVTGARSTSADCKVELQVNSGGNAKQTSADFSFFWPWSSTTTWGGGPVPVAADFPIIPPGMTILLDQTTPVMKMLLVQGKLIFDEKDIELHAEYILINDGGSIQVGTEDKPFQHNAEIVLHGNARSTELPIYGAKVLAVRNGTLDLHGKPVSQTWTVLAATANVGDKTLTLKDPVDWPVGGTLVIATTGHRHSQGETEKRVITAVSSDGKTITLDSALKYKHVAVTETYGGVDVNMRAEVGLLTRNVKVRGSNDAQWNDAIEACPDGFNTGEFVTQTCFQGRFGDEEGSDQYGAIILMHSPEPSKDLAVGRFSHIEVTYAGQAFRLGRYPIHFHLIGINSKSYVKGCAIHETFNRAINIHGTHNVPIEHNVVYHVMGGALFLEDGVETGNTFEYNLVIFVIASSSLLNDDITPAAYWVTNPNNTYRHNAAAGGTHFGFWYRMHVHPDGPSFDPTICPRNAPLGGFYNNTVHSNGWFGLWIFIAYTPRQDGSCSSTAAYDTAVFRRLIVWNCEKGAETVNGGNIQFVDFIMVHNEKAGIEQKLVLNGFMYDENNGTAVKNSLIVGRSPAMSTQPDWLTTGDGCTVGGIVLPYGNGLIIVAVKFYNFDKSNCSCFTLTKIDGTCTFLCGGFTYHFKQITYDNAGSRRCKFDHANHACLTDEDGTMTGKSPGSHVVPSIGDLPTSCTPLASCSLGVPASSCPASVSFIRFSFNEVLPSTLKGANLTLTNSHGSQICYFAFKRITHGNGWSCMLVAGETYTLEFQNASQVTNISYNALFSGVKSAVIICQKLERRPDRFSHDGSSPGRNASSDPLDTTNNIHGDWHYDNVTLKFCYIVAAKTSKKRATVAWSADDRPMQINAIKCYYANCKTPVDPNTIAPTCTRPTSTEKWSLIKWGKDSEGYIVNDNTGTSPAPTTDQKVKIIKGTYVIGDTTIPTLTELVLHGTLELDHGQSSPYRNFIIKVTYLFIRGGRLIGGCEESSPFLGKIDIILRGDHSTSPYPVTDGANLGSKAIGAFGGLDLHAKSVGTTWTHLAKTASAGSTQIELEEAVEWESGGEIVISPTRFKPKEAEVRTIQSVSADKKTITLTSALSYKHIAATDSFTGGQTLKLRAEVGYLTRNIRIIGESYSKQESEEFGGRVLVGLTADTNGNYYTGYARLSNVEFKRVGQFGWTEKYDPRYALSIMDVGDVGSASATRPCYVKSCSFNHVYNAAIGVFQTNGLKIENNVIYDTVHKALDIAAENTIVKHNLFTLNHGIGTYNGRYQSDKKDYSSSIYAVTAKQLVMQYNAVTGFEGLGYRGSPEDCATSTSDVEPWIDNVFHTGLIGVGIFPLDHGVSGFNSKDRCLQYANFTLWKCWDAGIFYNSIIDIKFHQNSFADNGVSLFPIIYGAVALNHICKKNLIHIEDNLFVGESSSFECTTDVVDANDPNIKWSAHNGRSWRIGGTGKVGASMGWCISGANNSPDKPLFNSMSYNAICCKTVFEDNTFANFQSTCNGGRDVAISTPHKADDAIHSVFVSKTKLQNVGIDNIVYIHRPRVQTVNPSDCVDMTCDGHRKVIVTDEDGTLLGAGSSTKVTATAQSEWQWDGDKRYGLGDSRIPKPMMTEEDGTRISKDVRAKYDGIIRDPTCVKKDVPQAWYCTGYDYYQLIIESMDADTETRRLSPIGVLGWDNNGNGYMDLLNGPQDHGWCAGYTCQKRLSTFTAVVAAGRNFSVYLTSTSPQYMRYQLLNAGSTVAVKIQQFLNTPFRISVYCDSVYIMPINAKIVNGKEELSPTTNRPDPNTGNCGDNYMDYDRKELHMVVKGSKLTEYKVTAAVFLGLNVPSLTVTQFFGPNLVNNLALFLNIPSNKIRVVNIKSSSVAGRRKRSTAGITTYQIEISNEPCTHINCTGSSGTPLTYENLQQFAVDIINSYQAGNLSEHLNITIIDLTVAEPLPPVTDSAWTLVVEAGDDYTTVIKVPHTIHIKEHPQPASEGNPFTSQPKLHMLDILGEQITKLGASTAPWKVTAELVPGSGSNSLAELIGTTNISFADGWANFTDLGISHDGSGYVIQFIISYPEEAVFNVNSSPLTIPQRSLKAAIVTKSSNIQKNDGVSITLEIKDGTTDQKVTDINWKGHLWLVTASMASPSSFGYGGALTGTTVGTFDPSTGEVVLNDLRLDESGIAVVKFIVASNPAGYQFELDVFVEVVSSEYADIIEDTTKEMKLKADLNCDTYCTDAFGAAAINSVLLSNNRGIRARDMTLSAGSVVITTTITGNTTTVQQVIDDVCNSISTGTTFTYNGQSYSLSSYMTIDGVSYYGVSCGETSDSDDKAKTGLLIGVIISVAIIIALIAGILYWRFMIYPKTKTHKHNFPNVITMKKGNVTVYKVQPYNRNRLEKDPRYLGKTGKSDYEDILWREDTFQSLRENSWIPEKIQPPVNTTFTPRSKEAFTGHI